MLYQKGCKGYAKRNNCNVLLLEREDFKLSIFGLNSEFPYTMQESLNILRSPSCWQSRDFNMERERRSNAMNDEISVN